MKMLHISPILAKFVKCKKRRIYGIPGQAWLQVPVVVLLLLVIKKLTNGVKSFSFKYCINWYRVVNLKTSKRLSISNRFQK